MDIGSVRQKFSAMHITPSGIIAMLFLFVLVFLWLFAYAPMLLGIPALDEAMFIVATGQGGFFSAGSMGESLLKLYPAVIFCTAYSFFFLDVRKYLPILVTVMATPRFLAAISSIAPVPLRYEEINSLFVVSQFIAMSLPFLLIERFSKGGFASWRAYFAARVDFPRRLQVMRVSAIGLLKELAAVSFFIGIGFLPSALTQGFSYRYIATYFIETSMVFFFGFYIIAGFQVLFPDREKVPLFNLFLACILYCAGLMACVFVVPMLLGLVFSPFLAAFGEGGLRASVAYSPGTTYLLSFYFMHCFLYSGMEGFTAFPLFLLSLVYVTGSSLAAFGKPSVRFSVPSLAGMVLVIACFGWLCSVISEPPARELVRPGEVFSLAIDESRGAADHIVPSDGSILLMDRGRAKITVLDRATGRFRGVFTLVDHEGSRHRGSIREVKFLQVRGSVIAGVTMGDDKGSGGSVRFYRIVSPDRVLRPVAEAGIEKGTALKAMVPLDDGAIALFTKSRSRELHAFAVPGGEWIWSSGDLGGAAAYAADDSGALLYGSWPEECVSFQGRSCTGAVDAKAPARGEALFYDPAGRGPLLFSLETGTLKEGGPGARDGDEKGPGWISSATGSSVQKGSGGWNELRRCMSRGFLAFGDRLICADRKHLYGIDRASGTKNWERPISGGKRFMHRFYCLGGLLLHLKDQGSRGIVTALVRDPETGAIVGRWARRGYGLRDAVREEDGTLLMSLEAREQGLKDMIVGIRFRKL